MSQFHLIKDAIQTKFDTIKHLPLFVSHATNDELWDTYIAKLTELGHNEIYRERGEHDCQCCKHFIRRMGNVVAIQDGKLVSIWDIEPTNSYYDEVAQSMSELVTTAGIRNIFLHDQDDCGTDSNVELLENGTAHTWSHFYLKLPPEMVVKDGHRRRKDLGNAGSYQQSLKLSMEQLTLEAVDDVLELVKDKALYRGEEHLSTLKLMRTLLIEYAEQDNKEHWLWLKSRELGARSTIRSTVIGTLVKDISAGIELESAVKAFESKVAPHNYKRSSALVTKGMIKKAEATVTELGMLESLPRRHAKITDITVNNVLFSDKTTQQQMDGVFGQLLAETKDTINTEHAEDIDVDTFIGSVLPQVETMDVYLDNQVASSNAMSLVAPVNPQAPNMLKWDNNFSWAYNGDVTDSIKERVKTAGGNVEGALRISLAWSNSDDLDIHMLTPHLGHISFSNKKGILDVDMNAMGSLNSNNPVENLTFKNKRDIANGIYTVKVNNYRKRNNGDPSGFTIEMEYEGKVTQFTYDKPLRDKGTVDALTFEYLNGKLEIISSLPSTQSSRETWGLTTQKLHRVSSVMLSPNHWDDNTTGNKHYFFLLDGFKNPEPVRGFYNEFLSENLREHRKVFEMLGSKMKAEYSDEQLSGLGFSSTQRNSVVVRVKGAIGTRLLNIKF